VEHYLNYGLHTATQLPTFGAVMTLSRLSHLTAATLLPLFSVASLAEQAGDRTADNKPIPSSSGNPAIEKKLEDIIIPEVKLDYVHPNDAFNFLREQAKANDKSTLDPSKKGVDIVVKMNHEIGSARVSLDLRNAPLRDVLSYICELSNAKFRVERSAIRVVPLSDPAF